MKEIDTLDLSGYLNRTDRFYFIKLTMVQDDPKSIFKVKMLLLS